MPEIVPIDEVLTKVQHFSPLQRILLTTAGTLQSTLAAYFGSPVTVAVITQRAQGYKVYSRQVELRCQGRAVCDAYSTLTIEKANIRKAVEAKKIGIGQILEAAGLRPKFTLIVVEQSPIAFWRHYTLEVPGVTYQIQETFRKELYP